jgi:hypothetical protein
MIARQLRVTVLAVEMAARPDRLNVPRFVESASDSREAGSRLNTECERHTRDGIFEPSGFLAGLFSNDYVAHRRLELHGDGELRCSEGRAELTYLFGRELLDSP